MSLHLDILGRGEPLVVLNGYPVTVDYVRPLGERLAQHHRVAIVHLPGYGESPALAPYEADRSHELVEEALLASGIAEASVIGFSFGFYRALALALRGRVAVRSLVGLGGIAGYEPDQAEQFRALAESLVDAATLADVLELVMLSDRAKQRPELVDEVRSWAAATSIENIRAEVVALSQVPHLLPRVPDISAPMLLRVGEDDVAAPPARSQEIAAVARRCRLELVPGVGHLIIREDLDGNVASIERFLSVVEQNGTP